MFGFNSFAETSYSDFNTVAVSVSVTGVGGTTALGTVTPRNVNRTFPTGVSATASVNSVSSVTGTAVVSPTGVAATGAVGSVTITADSTFTVTGVAATGAIGKVHIPIFVTGVSATGAIGTVTITEGSGATALPTGVSATMSLGSVTITGEGTVPATGLAATGQIGQVLVWGEIVPDSGTIWTPVAA